jgi:hypothetical protein
MRAVPKTMQDLLPRCHALDSPQDRYASEQVRRKEILLTHNPADESMRGLI